MTSLRLQTMALLGQQFLTQAIANGGSLNDAVAGMFAASAPQPGKPASASLLTGRLRGDSGATRQAAGRASENALMASAIKNATFSIGDTLNRMQNLAQAVANNEISASGAAGAFDSFAASLRSTITNTKHDGISLLDKNGWNGDDRLVPDAFGRSASVIPKDGSAASFTVRDLSAMTGFTAAEALAPDNIHATLDTIAAHIETVNTISSGYESLAGAYTAEARQLTHQADLLDTASERSGTGENTTGDLSNTLFDLMLRDQGKLVDKSS